MIEFLKTFTLEYGIAKNTQLIKPQSNVQINNIIILVRRCARVGIPNL